MTERLCRTRHEEGWRCNQLHSHDGKHKIVGAKGTVIASWWKNNGPANHEWKERT
jgi:hypothetical protein